MINGTSDPFRKQNGRRRGDLPLRSKVRVLRFGTFLWNGGTLAGTGTLDVKAGDDVLLSRESPPFFETDPILEWP